MKLNVLHLIDSFNTGGSERQAIQLVRLLHENGRFRVHVACLNRKGPLEATARQNSSGEIAEFPLTSFYDWNMTVQTKRFVKLLKERRIDVVQTHDFYTNIFGMFGSRLVGVPVRIASRRETIGTRTATQKKIERVSYRFSHAIIANAQAVRSQLLAEGIGDQKIEVIYNGVAMPAAVRPSEGESQTIRARFRLPSDRKLITLVANLKLPVKDHPMFLRAARRVKDEHPNAAFVLAGEGALTEEIRALAESIGIGADLFFTGRCEDVPALLSVSEIGVLSSKAEGFSNSILEYMAAGKPVVATNVGGAREAVVEDQTGYLVAPGDDQMMATQILKLLRDPELARRMGEAGRLIVERGFSCAAQLAKTENLYDGLLARRRAGRSPNLERTHPSEPQLRGEHSLQGK